MFRSSHNNKKTEKRKTCSRLTKKSGIGFSCLVYNYPIVYTKSRFRHLAGAECAQNDGSFREEFVALKKSVQARVAVLVLFAQQVDDVQVVGIGKVGRIWYVKSHTVKTEKYLSKEMILTSVFIDMFDCVCEACLEEGRNRKVVENESCA